MAIPNWDALTIYPLGSRVLDPSYHIQRVVGGKAGSSTPSWNDAGGTTNDGSLVWKDRGVGAWAANTVLALGTPILDANGHIQKVVGGVSGASTPAWDNTPTGATSDGSLIWKYEGFGGESWTPSTPVSFGRQVYSYTYNPFTGLWATYLQQVVGGRAGHTTPAWNSSGGTTIDGSLIWTDQGPGSGPSGWQPSAYPYTNSTSSYYSVGAEVVDSNGHIQKVTALNGASTGAAEPAWAYAATYYTDDGSVLWQNQGTSSATTWLANSCYAMGSAVRDSHGATQAVAAIDGAKTGSTAPAWNEGGFTKDGSVMWYDQGPNTTTWLADSYYLVGATVVDPGGHLQQVTALNDATSGSSDPTWDDEGGNTYDGTITWQDEGGNPPSRTTQTVVEAASTLSTRTGRTTQVDAQAAIWWNPRTARQTQLAQQTAVWWLPRTARETQLVILLARSLLTPMKKTPRLLPFLKTYSGGGQTVNELEGQSSIGSLEITANDPDGELKYLATKPGLVGKVGILKMGFERMNLSDFVPLHVVQISDVGRTEDHWMRFGCRDNLALLDRALWYCGGPHPVALPWLFGQAYTAGQYVQDSNGNIERAVVGGITDPELVPVWPATLEPGWQPHTMYPLGTWITDGNGNLQQLTDVPSGSTSTRPLNMGESGRYAPTWATTLGATTVDDNGGNESNGPITWTLIAINELGQEVTDGTVTWELVAKPGAGAFGGSQAFYVYSLYGQNIQTPQPPARDSFTTNGWPTRDDNPRYIQGNPIDVLLVALQNELGLGQDPALEPIVTSDPNDPSNPLVFAPNPAWQQYVSGDDSTLINPNPFVRLDSILAVRNYQASGRRFEWIVKRAVTAKQWIQDEICKPLGLFLYVHADGSIDLKAMGAPPPVILDVVDQNTIKGTPALSRIPIVNINTVRGDVDDEGAYSAARVYGGELTYAQRQSLAIYLQEFAQSAESNGLREACDSYGVGYLLSDRVFRRHGFGTPEYELKLHLSELRREIGDFFLLTHPLIMDYMSTTARLGVANVLVEIVDRQPDYAGGEITLKVWDTRFMGLASAYQIAPAAAEIPNWDSASAAQRAQYMFISHWPGYNSDGTPGNTIAADASGPAYTVSLTPPLAPSSLQVNAGNATVFLSWGLSQNASGYNVLRSTSSGGPYTAVASNIPDPFYADTGLSNGTTYYYVVNAMNAAGTGADSSQIAATPGGSGSGGGGGGLPGGAVLAFGITYPGTGYAPGVYSTAPGGGNPGSGSDFTITVHSVLPGTDGIASASIDTIGSGYGVMETGTIGSGGATYIITSVAP